MVIEVETMVMRINRDIIFAKSCHLYMKVLGLLVFYCLEGVPFDIIYCYGYVVGIIYFIGYSFDIGKLWRQTNVYVSTCVMMKAAKTEKLVGLNSINIKSKF